MSRIDRYGRRKVKHSERNFATREVIELLTEILTDIKSVNGEIIPLNANHKQPA
jgi:hypothetical protein